MRDAPPAARAISLVAKYNVRVVESGLPERAPSPAHRLYLGRVPPSLAQAIRVELPSSTKTGSARSARDSRGRRAQLLVTAHAADMARLAENEGSAALGVREIALAGRYALESYARPTRFLLKGLHRSCRIAGECRVMGVLNLTPDSFSDGGRYLAPGNAVAHARQLLAEGAHLLDLGAESTRPGARPVSARAEWARLAPVLARVHSFSPVPLSVDTRKPEVARLALAHGADLVNDVGGLRSGAMRALLAKTGAPAIAMHMRGVPGTMQRDTTYEDLRTEVYGTLAEALSAALRAGMAPSQFLVDPGLGFGKSPAQSLELLAHLGEFRSLGVPVVVGASRKSMLGFALGGAPVTERAEAGLAAAVIAAREGASIVRVHEVAPTLRALTLLSAVQRAGAPPRPAAG